MWELNMALRVENKSCHHRTIYAPFFRIFVNLNAVFFHIFGNLNATLCDGILDGRADRQTDSTITICPPSGA